MLTNDFRRIALAQGLLPVEPPRPPPDDRTAERNTKPASGAPEPCEDRDDAA